MKLILLAVMVMVILGCNKDNTSSTVDTPPVAPDNLTAKAVSNSQINLSWTDKSTNETGFKIERKTGSVNFAEIANVGKDVSTFSDVGLPVFKTYTYRVYAYNSVGKSLIYSNEVSATTFYPIGQVYGGGVIFYIDSTGNHGLIAATSNQGDVFRWGCLGNSIPGTLSAVGTGAPNTAKIIAGCGEAGIAARICDELVLNGYSDWFLPSIEELRLMYNNKEKIGGFLRGPYWSSTENSGNLAWELDFGIGSAYNVYKTYTYYVRAVRAF